MSSETLHEDAEKLGADVIDNLRAMFTEGALTAVEAAAKGEAGGGDGKDDGADAPSKDGSLGIGSLRKVGGQDK